VLRITHTARVGWALLWIRRCGTVESVFVAGKPMKRNEQLLHVDGNAVKKTVNESRHYVIKKSGFRLSQI
jgi:hypothetical protein